MSTMTIPLRTREAIEQEIERRLDAERSRLQASIAAQRPRTHFQRPVERPFTAAERDRVTILFGGLTSKHEWLIKSAFQSAGYKVEVLPTPDVASFQLGKEFGNNGQCNPTYFTVGHLIKYLQQLESVGIPRQDIVNNYVFFTAGSCGPCRFGMYTYPPFFSAYFESLGVLGGNVVYSDYTSGDLYREGAGRGAIDPCFPAKIGVAHVHNLLLVKHAKKKLDYIFFPMVDVLHTSLKHLQGSNACPTVTVTPETAKAAFTKEGDVFAQQGVRYLCPMINFADRPLLCKQLFEA